MKMKFWHLKPLQEIKKNVAIKKKIDEYLGTWQRLKEPHLRDMTKQLARLWVKIEEMWAMEPNINNTKTWYSHMKLLDQLIGRWNLILTRMGLTYTAQAYLTKEERVQTPKEMLEFESSLEELKEVGKGMQKEVKKTKRLNKGGRREPEKGVPLQVVAEKGKKKNE